MGQGSVGFGDRNKRREGVTRLIKLFTNQNFRIYKFKILFNNKIFSTQIKFYT